MGFYRFGEFVGNELFPFFQGLALIDFILNVIIPPDIQLAVLVLKAMGPGELVDVFEEGLVAGNVLVAHIVGEPVLVDFPDKGRVLQKGLDFGAVQEVSVLFVVIKGLDAENVPGAEELLLRLVPDDKGEHPPELLKELRAVFLVAVEQHLRIGGGFEDVAFFDQVFPQFPEIVNFAVKGEDLGAVLV